MGPGEKYASFHIERKPRGGGGVLPYMGYIGMRRWEGEGFQAVYSRVGVKGSRLPAAHPHPEIPKVPPPGRKRAKWSSKGLIHYGWAACVDTSFAGQDTKVYTTQNGGKRSRKVRILCFLLI